MVVTSVSTTIDIDLDDVLYEMSDDEKEYLLKDLLNESCIGSKEVAKAIDESYIDPQDVVDELLDMDAIDATDEKDSLSVYDVDYDSCRDESEFVSRVLEAMPMYDLKKALCNAFYVGSYTDEDKLREKLESVITAK